MSGNITCQLPIDLASKPKPKRILSHRSSKIDVFHNNQDGYEKPLNFYRIILLESLSNLIWFVFFLCRTPNVTPKEHIDNSNNGISEFNPAYSFELKSSPSQCEVDTFDHILQVTSHHEAVYAYYYTDDNNKVRSNQ